MQMSLKIMRILYPKNNLNQIPNQAYFKIIKMHCRQVLLSAITNGRKSEISILILQQYLMREKSMLISWLKDNHRKLNS